MNKHLIIILFLLSVVFSYSEGSFEFREAGARSAALAGAYTAFADDAEALWVNPAGLRFAEGIEASTFYTKLYGIGDLSSTGLSLVVPTLAAGAWGFGFSSFGPSDYREQELKLGFASRIGEGFYFGAAFKRQSLKIGNGGGSASAFGIDASVSANVNENFRLAASVLNINSPTLGSTSETPARRVMIGARFRPYEGVMAAIDMHKPVDADLQYRTGLELVLAETLTLRAGVKTKPARFSFGFGINWAIFSLDYAFMSHSVLPGSHLFALNAYFGQRSRGRDKIDLNLGTKERYTGVININKASSEAIAKLPGMGSVMAKKIVEYRARTGDFRSVNELRNIYGFSDRMFEKIRDYITVKETGSGTFRRIKMSQPALPRPERPEPSSGPIGPIQAEEQEVGTRPEPDMEIHPYSDALIQPDPLPVRSEPVLKTPPAIEAPVQPERMKKAVSRVDINEANIKDLDDIEGVSYTLARNIIRHRRLRGRFSSWEELLKVPGITPSVLEQIKKYGEIR